MGSISELVDDETTETNNSEPTTTAPTSAPSGSEFLDLLLNKIEPINKSKTKLKIMIYSDPGAGKTTFAGQVPNNLIIDAEEGTQSILNHPELMAEGVARLPYKTFEGLEKTIEEFHKAPEQLSRFTTISIDSLSNLHKRGLAEVTEREWQKNPALNNRYVAETEHHTENNEHIRRLVQQMCDLPQNVILTAHKRLIEPKNMPAKTFPDFSEKLANTISGMMDIVAYMYMAEIDGEEKRVMKFHPSSGIAAKCRWASFPDNMVDPTWAKVQEILDK